MNRREAIFGAAAACGMASSSLASDSVSGKDSLPGRPLHVKIGDIPVGGVFYDYLWRGNDLHIYVYVVTKHGDPLPPPDEDLHEVYFKRRSIYRDKYGVGKSRNWSRETWRYSHCCYWGTLDDAMLAAQIHVDTNRALSETRAEVESFLSSEGFA